LVNNAGIVGRFGDLCDLDEATLRRVIEVNIIGYVLFAREVIRGLKATGESGAIVNVSSRAAVLGAPHEWIHYALTKGAIDTFTVGLAREVAELGIRVNAVRPGLIDTALHAMAGRPDRLTELAGTVPMRRGGEAEEVADAILYLLSESASYVTGTCLDVAGGR
jgi:NAD(P)-dependent dehydrogenase (short-subunit alcohol dehydrogenase family)